MKRLYPQTNLLYNTLCLLLLVSPTHATTWIVQQEPGGHFVHVQDAIDASTHGDTILVMPGIYFENIDLNGKNVVLTSTYLFTEDKSDIDHTILDGNHSGRVLTIISGENRNCQIIGFTIQSGVIILPETGGGIQGGAGIRIEHSSPSIISCVIKNNNAGFWGSGGGISIRLYSSPFLSGLRIFHNSAGWGQGGIGISHPLSNVEFDSELKCSVYNNYAGRNSDINMPYTTDPQVEIHLDTITAPFLAEEIQLWAPGNIVHYENTILERVPHNLYVSPDGNDTNSGQSPDEALKTIQYALSLIESDSLIRRKIYLDEGTYSPSSGQYFPLNIRSNVDLIGAGKNLTILDGENQTTLISAFFDSHFAVRNMTIKNCVDQGQNPFAVKAYECTNAEFINIKFSGNDGGSIQQGQVGFIPGYEYLHPLETSVIFDSLEIVDNNCKWNTQLGTCKTMVLRNSVIDNTQAIWDEIWELYLNYPLQIRQTFDIDDPINIIQNVAITRSENMDAWGPDYAIGMFVNSTYARLINCTIADNLLPDFMGGGITLGYGAEVVMVNSIVHGNTPNQVWLANSYNLSPNSLVVKNCLMEGAEEGVGQSGENTLNWLSDNFSADPWFQGGEDHPYHLTENSPAIDAGTAFFVWEGDTIVDLSPEEYYGSAPDIGAYEWTGNSNTHENILPQDFKLYGNYPNPFNNRTVVRFSLPQASPVLFSVVDLKGRELMSRDLGLYQLGEHQIKWNAENLASGIYIIRLTSDFGSQSIQSLLLK